MNRIKSTLLRKDFLFSCVVATCAGVLVGLPFFIGALWFVSLGGVALFLHITRTARSVKFACAYGWIAGFVFYGMLFGAVVMSLFPFTWYGIEHPYLQVAVIFAVWLCSAFVMGSAWGVVGLGVRILKTDSLFDALIFPSVWVLGELVSSLVYYMYTLGSGSLFGLHFTFGYLGYIAAEDYALLQLASIGGVYLLSFVLVSCAALLMRAYVGSRKSVYLLSVCVLLWIFAHSFFMLAPSSASPEGTVLSVAVISRYLPPGEHEEETYTREYEALLELITPLEGLDVLVFPENATFTRTLFTEDHAAEYKQVVATGRTSRGPVIVDSQDSLQHGVFSSQVIFADTVDRSFGEKQFLMPFGEYIPSAYQLVVSAFGGKDVILKAVQARNYVPGDEPPLHRIGTFVLALRFCDEVMSPFLYYTQVREGAHMLLNLSSYSWFQGSPYIHTHMQRIAQVRAVESGRFYVQSGNMSPAFILNDRGEVVAETNGKQLEVLTAPVEVRSHITWYVRTGAWTHIALYIGILGACFFERKRRKKV